MTAWMLTGMKPRTPELRLFHRKEVDFEKSLSAELEAKKDWSVFLWGIFSYYYKMGPGSSYKWGL